MQREREREERRAGPAAHEVVPGIGGASPAERARTAAAGAAAIAAPEPAGITVSVRPTVGQAGAVRLVATPDTTVAEIHAEACRALGLRDAGGFALVAGGRVLGEGAQRLGDLAEELEAEEVVIRLVRRPEAGAVRAAA
jgi:hypothetical protein